MLCILLSLCIIVVVVVIIIIIIIIAVPRDASRGLGCPGLPRV